MCLYLQQVQFLNRCMHSECSYHNYTMRPLLNPPIKHVFYVLAEPASAISAQFRHSSVQTSIRRIITGQRYRYGSFSATFWPWPQHWPSWYPCKFQAAPSSVRCWRHQLGSGIKWTRFDLESLPGCHCWNVRWRFKYYIGSWRTLTNPIQSTVC